MKRLVLALLLSLCPALLSGCATCTDNGRAALSGEVRQWHTITLTFDGPQTSETADPNPFLDYRLDVTFANNDLNCDNWRSRDHM